MMEYRMCLEWIWRWMVCVPNRPSATSIIHEWPFSICVYNGNNNNYMRYIYIYINRSCQSVWPGVPAVRHVWTRMNEYKITINGQMLYIFHVNVLHILYCCGVKEQKRKNWRKSIGAVGERLCACLQSSHSIWPSSQFRLIGCLSATAISNTSILYTYICICINKIQKQIASSEKMAYIRIKLTGRLYQNHNNHNDNIFFV